MKPVELIKKYYSFFNRAKWSSMVDLLDEKIRHDINEGGFEIGKAKFAHFLSMMDNHYTEKLRNIKVMVDATGARASAEFIVEGVYKKSAPGLPPARGQKYSLPAGTFFEINKRTGKIKRVTTYYNLADWIRQVRG